MQPLWLALANGTDPAKARALIGRDRIRLSPEEIKLLRSGPDLERHRTTRAADRIAALLRAQGFTRALVDMGEIAALGERAGPP